MAGQVAAAGRISAPVVAVLGLVFALGPGMGAADHASSAPCGAPSRALSRAEQEALGNDATSASRALAKLAAHRGRVSGTLGTARAVRVLWRGDGALAAAESAFQSGERRVVCLLRSVGKSATGLAHADAIVRGLTARQLAYLDGLWALQAHRAEDDEGVGQEIAVTVAAQAERCFAVSSALLAGAPASPKDGCEFSNPEYGPARAATDDSGCDRGARLPVEVATGLARTTQGRVLAGTGVRSQVVHGLDNTFSEPNPLGAHYPNGRLPEGPPQWRDIEAIGPAQVIHTSQASAVFNSERSKYRIAFNLSHYGEQPVNIGDFSSNGVDDLAISDHFSYVDGMRYAGEIDIYYGHRGRLINPTEPAETGRRRDLGQPLLRGRHNASGPVRLHLGHRRLHRRRAPRPCHRRPLPRRPRTGRPRRRRLPLHQPDHHTLVASRGLGAGLLQPFDARLP